jgi:hypothetical protein
MTHLQRKNDTQNTKNLFAAARQQKTGTPPQAAQGLRH